MLFRSQFKDAFRRINELFITEAKKYNVGKQLKKEVTEISLDAVNQVNENIDLAELMTAKREYTLSKEQIKAAINALPIQKTPGVGMFCCRGGLNLPENCMMSGSFLPLQWMIGSLFGTLALSFIQR